MSGLLSPGESRQAIRAALADRAELCRKTATSRALSGPRNAEARAAIRREGVHCLELALRLEHVSPAALAALLSMRTAGDPR